MKRPSPFMSDDDQMAEVLRHFQEMPNVGPATAKDFWDLGFRKIDDLKNADADELYERMCAIQGVRLDRCVLYVFRASIYLARTKHPDPRKIVWWAWKDPEKKPSRTGSRGGAKEMKAAPPKRKSLGQRKRG